MFEKGIDFEGYKGQIESNYNGYEIWLCGYVFIPESHPLYKCRLGQAERSIICHGGITFAGRRTAFFDCSNRFAIGFDCTHLGDSIVRWNVEAVEKELESIILQLIRMEGKK